MNSDTKLVCPRSTESVHRGFCRQVLAQEAAMVAFSPYQQGRALYGTRGEAAQLTRSTAGKGCQQSVVEFSAEQDWPQQAQAPTKHREQSACPKLQGKPTLGLERSSWLTQEADQELAPGADRERPAWHRSWSPET